MRSSRLFPFAFKIELDEILNSHSGIRHAGRMLFLAWLLVLVNAVPTPCADTKTVTVVNHSGKKASDMHMEFRGTGGNLTVDPNSVTSPPGCDKTTVSTSGNGVDIVWKPDGCAGDGAAISFKASTKAPGPLEFGGGHWTGADGTNIAEMRSEEVSMTSAPEMPAQPTGAGYQLLAPEVVEQGAEFTGLVVEDTPTGLQPIPSDNQVVFSGTVIPDHPNGEVPFRPLDEPPGNYFIGVRVVPANVTGTPITEESFPSAVQHVEVVPPTESFQPTPSKVAHASSIVKPGMPLRVEGQNLGVLEKAALKGPGDTEIPLENSAGSSLQRIYLPPTTAKIPEGEYRFVAWDKEGNRYDAPNVSTNPHLSLSGPAIKKRGQEGEFTVMANANSTVELSGGEPIVSYQEKTVRLHANVPAKVKFKANEVGQYSVNAKLYSPEESPALPGQPHVDTVAQPVEARYNPQANTTNVKAPVKVVDSGGNPVENVPVDVAVTHPGGVEYAQVTTNDHGVATVSMVIPGNIAAKAIAPHVYRVEGYDWKPPIQPGGGHPRTGERPVIAGLWGCAHDCTPGQKQNCTLDDITLMNRTGNPALQKRNGLKQSLGTLTGLHILDVVSILAELPEGLPPTALLGGLTIDEAKELAKKLKERENALLGQSHVTVTLNFVWEECEQQKCFWSPYHEEVWVSRHKDVILPPPGGCSGADCHENEWAPGTFDMTRPDVAKLIADEAVKVCGK